MKRFLAGLITGYVTSLLIVPGSGKANQAQLKVDMQKRNNQLKAVLNTVAADIQRLIGAARNQFPQ